MKKTTLLAPVAAAAMLLTAATAAHADGNVSDDWALARITQTGPITPSQTSYAYNPNSHGEGVNAYVIDAGIDYDNPDLAGRAAPWFDAYHGDGRPCANPPAGDPTDTRHGTEVADVLGGTKYGVANKVNLFSVKARDCNAATDAAAVDNFIAAINYVADHHVSPAVAVLSYNWNGAGYFRLLDQLHQIELTNAVNHLAASKVFIAVSAGNVTDGTSLFATDLYSVENPPGDAAQAMVVMASDAGDRAPLNTTYAGDQCSSDKATVTWSTAFGGDIYAPGVAVPTWFGPQCGTSEAAPMVAGVAAMYKATFGDADSATVKSWILAHATQGAITNNPTGGISTPNLLLNTGGL